MTATGYVGETSINEADAATGLGWVMLGIAMLAWLYIVCYIV